MNELMKVFVVPGEGVKIPLPVDGMLIPKEGRLVARSLHIERLLRTKDLVEVAQPAAAPAAQVAPKPAPAAPANGEK